MGRLEKVSLFIIDALFSTIGSGYRRTEEYAKKNGLRLKPQYYKKKAHYESVKSQFYKK